MKKNCIYIQRDSSSCGACSIASVVSFYNGYVPLETIIEDTLTDKNGTTAYHIKEALNKYGFNAYGINCTFDNIVKLKFPVICHTIIDGFEHFLVIYDIKDDIVITMDPRIGKKAYVKGDFKRIFTNQVIIVEPVGKIANMPKKSTLKGLLCKEYILEKKKIILSMIISVTLLVINIFLSYYLKIIYLKKKILFIFCLFIFLVLYKFIMLIIKDNIHNMISIKFQNRLNDLLIQHIFNLKLRYLNNKRVGDIIRRINDLSYIKEWFLNISLNTTLDIIIFITSFFLLYFINGTLWIIVLFSVIAQIFISFITSSYLYKRENSVLNCYNEYSSDLTEYMEGIESIKNLNKENLFRDKIKTKFNFYLINHYDLSHHHNIITYTKDFLEMLTYLTFTTYAVMFYSKSALIDIVVFNSIYSILYTSLSNVLALIPSFIHIKTIFRDSSEFLDIGGEVGTIDFNENIKRINVKQLSYSYDHIHSSINNISFDIKPNDKVFLKGKSGIGKSTIARCMAGIYDDYDGAILLNGINIKDINPILLKNKITYISQNEKLFKGTIKDNITMGNNSDDLDNILDITLSRDIIVKKLGGINSMILENATNLSGGERARIILARALLNKPEVLIIDETLSSISEADEDKIIKMLLKTDLTIIYITHRDKEKLFNKVIELRKDGIHVINK